MKPLLFLDTETTGIENGRCIEFAHGQKDGEGLSISEYRFKNPVPIEIAAMAVHHITEEMVSDLPLFQDHDLYPEIKKNVEKSIVVAHNAKFDIGVLAYEDIHVTEFVDTKRVAKHLLPDAPRHNLQYLRYYLKLDIGKGEQIAHSAAGDVRVLIALYEYLEKIVSDTYPDKDAVYMMQVLSRTPALVKSLQFGKYYGKTFEEIAKSDIGYLQYLKQNPRDDEDVIYTVNYWLKQMVS